MTVTITPPHTSDAGPATGSGDHLTLFLAPPTVQEEDTTRVSDHGQDAMRRLRHPFAVTGPAPLRTP